MNWKNIQLTYFKKDLWRAFAMIFRASPKTAIYSFIILLFQSVLPVAVLYNTKKLIESITRFQHIQFNNILSIIVTIGSIQLINALTNQWAIYIGTIQQQKITDYLNTIVLEKAISVDYEYYENPKYHDTLHMAQQQSFYKATQLLNNMNAVIAGLISIIFLSWLFISLHWIYAIVFILLSLPLAAIKWYYSYKMLQLEWQLAPIERKGIYLNKTLVSINYAKEVRVFGYGLNFIKQFRAIKKTVFNKRRSLQMQINKYSLLAEVFETGVTTIIFILLAKNVWQQIITVGVFVIYLQGFQRMQNTVKSFIQSLVQLIQQRIFMRDLFGFLDIPTQHENVNQFQFPNIQNGLIIENLSFKYPDTTNEILSNINITAKPGNIIAIVGENGSGKSSLVKLLARLYHNQKGNISIGKTNILDIDIDEYRKNAVFLFQDYEKYFFTVEENILLGQNKSDVKEEDIIKAATLSGADEFIHNLSKGYQTPLGRTFTESEQLSGGQWQKLALARIFFRNAQLIILDEPTSAIDALAEFDLFKQFKAIAADKIVILISHKLYNIKIANYIYVMQNGSIAEEGNFTELINKNGLFSSMYQKQKLDD